MSYIFKMIPVFKLTIWGGTNLKTKFGKNAPFDNIAESWEVSCHPSGLSVIENGIYKSKNLKEILENNRELWGSNININTTKFPLLFKLIDASQNLSVQVHPDDEMVKAENESGKNEMWIVLAAEKNAGIYAGFKTKITKEVFKEHIEKGTLEDVLNFIPVKKRDSIFIRAGTVHAIGKGVVIAEIQQSSDITYRVFDYNRIDNNNKKRELHIEKALMATNYFDKECLFNKKTNIENGNKINTLPYSENFYALNIEINDSFKNNTLNKSFEIIFVSDGKGTIKCLENKLDLKKGDTVFIPADVGEFEITGKINIYRFYIKENI